MKSTTKPLSSSAFVAAAALVVVGFAAFNRLNSVPAVPVSVLAGVDASESVRVKNAGGGTLLGQARGALSSLTASLNAASDHLLVARVDREVTPFYDKEPVAGRHKMLGILLHETQPSSQSEGTRPAKFWTLVAERAADAQRTPGEAVFVVYYGDGDNDDQSPHAARQMRLAAQQLAQNSRVKAVWFYGVKRENWRTIETTFAPLGGRLRLATKNDMTPASIIKSIEKARRDERENSGAQAQNAVRSAQNPD